MNPNQEIDTQQDGQVSKCSLCFDINHIQRLNGILVFPEETLKEALTFM